MVMNAFWTRLFARPPLLRDADRLHQAIARQARQAAFYEHLEVPDTIDGRFDLLVLHAVLAFDALAERSSDARRLAQAACDRLFKGLEAALREIGIGDLTVPKKMKAMAGAYQGRADRYREALAAPGDGALEAALRRNVYRGHTPSPAAVQALAAYVRATAAGLRAADLARFAEGTLAFPDPRARPAAA